MAKIIIPVADYRNVSSRPVIPSGFSPATGMLNDALQRPLKDLRISITDRCNFRCVYCMPKQVFDKNYQFLPHSALLSFEEITRVAKIFVAHGVEKIRLTGGEPLLRKNVERLVEMLSNLKTCSGRDLDLTLTTNGSLLAKKARALREAGLKRVTVSLDSLDDVIFKRMNDVNFPVTDVLRGIQVAQDAGLGPVKVNMVVKAGMNDAEIIPMARYFRGSGVILRFIEYMDVGASNGWKMDEVVPSSEVVRRIHAVMPLQQVEPNHSSETAERWQYLDGSGEIGVISSVTQAFCRDCTRARLSTEGKIYTCLFASYGHDLRRLLRGQVSDEEIAAAIAGIWHNRSDRYSELRTADTEGTGKPMKKIEMSYIGG